MSQQEKRLRFKGIVRAYSRAPGVRGKQFLGALIECSDGMVWVIDYGEQSPYHAFADRHVLVSGEPYKPKGQMMILLDKRSGHFRVSTMRLIDVTPDAELEEVGAEQELSGQFKRDTSHKGGARLSFVTDNGDNFFVANDPAGALVGRRVDVRAYPVQPSASIRKPDERYLWIICPCSCADLEA